MPSRPDPAGFASDNVNSDNSSTTADFPIESAKIATIDPTNNADNIDRVVPHTALTASGQVKSSEDKAKARKNEEKRMLQDYDEFVKLLKDNEPYARQIFMSTHALATQVKSVSTQLITTNIILEQLVKDVAALSSGPTIAALPTYAMKAVSSPPGRAAKRRFCLTMKHWAARKSLHARQRAIAGNDVRCLPIKDKDLDDGYDSGDDNFDPYIPDEQFHGTWGYLLHRKTAEFIGHSRISEVTSFIKAGYISMARIGKLEKSFTNLPLDTRTILVNGLEDAFYDFFAMSVGHQKALQALQEVGGQLGLGVLMKQYPAFPIPPTPSSAPSGLATPLTGSSSNPILVGEVSRKLQKSLPAPIKVKSEPATHSLPVQVKREPGLNLLPCGPEPSVTKRLLEEEEEAPKAKRRKSTVFGGTLSTPSVTPAPTSAHTFPLSQKPMLPGNPPRAPNMAPPSSTPSMRPPHASSLYVTPANPQAAYATPQTGSTNAETALNAPLPCPAFDIADTLDDNDQVSSKSAIEIDPGLEEEDQSANAPMQHAAMDIDEQTQFWNPHGPPLRTASGGPIRGGAPVRGAPRARGGASRGGGPTRGGASRGGGPTRGGPPRGGGPTRSGASRGGPPTHGGPSTRGSTAGQGPTRARGARGASSRGSRGGSRTPSIPQTGPLNDPYAALALVPATQAAPTVRRGPGRPKKEHNIPRKHGKTYCKEDWLKWTPKGKATTADFNAYWEQLGEHGEQDAWIQYAEDEYNSQVAQWQSTNAQIEWAPPAQPTQAEAEEPTWNEAEEPGWYEAEEDQPAVQYEYDEDYDPAYPTYTT